MKIHHLGIVVTNIDEGLSSLGLNRADITETIFDREQKNNLYFTHLKDNDLWVEFVEPAGSGSTVLNFAKKNESGLHHLGFLTDDLISLKAKSLKTPGSFPLGSYKLAVDSFGGKIQTMFVAIKGLLLEFVTSVK